MIIGILKERESDQSKIPGMSYAVNKKIASGEEVIFELKIKNESEILDYEIKFIDDEKYVYYIYDKSDIINRINIDGFEFLVISGNIETYSPKEKC